MKRETYAILLGGIFVAIIVMTTNTAIADYQINTAIANAQSIKIEHKVRPAEPIEISLTKNFGIYTKETDQNDVLVLQDFLSANNLLDKKNISGVFDPQTLQAVRDFQKTNNITPATGFIGDTTRQKINEQISQN